MRILVTNDDGIDSPGIIKLAKAAAALGDVTVMAPLKQCSAMSHHITLDRNMHISEYDFPVQNVKAYALDGTPADCVRSCLVGLLKDEMPDLVLSGINAGSNCGFDVLYSATVGAAMEAILYGVPAICFSQGFNECSLDPETRKIHAHGFDEVITEVCDEMLGTLLSEYINKDAGKGKIWSINFPNCHMKDYKGVLTGRFPAATPFWNDWYVMEGEGDEKQVVLKSEPLESAEEGSDIRALMEGYISIGTLQNTVLMGKETFVL